MTELKNQLVRLLVGSAILTLTTVAALTTRHHFSPIHVTEWGQTTGTVISHDVISRTGIFTTQRGPRTFYGPSVVYSYMVDGVHYRSDRVYLNRDRARGTELSRSSARALAEAYPIGTEVTVWYDRAAPAIAVLERSTRPNQDMAEPWKWPALIATTAMFFLLSLWVTLAALWNLARLLRTRPSPPLQA
jgi:hypothetical protein